MSSSFMSASPLTPANLLAQSAIAQTKAKAKANAAATTGTASTSNDGLTGSAAGSTFLNLLVKELQNQDPTAPMDSTAMVGQMISLNQLDQLISINQTLGGVSSSANAVSAGQGSTNSTALMAARASLLNSSAPSASDAATSAASDPSSTLDFSKLNIPNGGK